MLKCLETAFGTALQNLSSWIGDSETDIVGKNRCLLLKPKPDSVLKQNSLKQGIHYNITH